MENAIAQYSLSEQIAYANAVCKAGIIPDAYRGKPADIIVAMGFGQSMGLSPAESLYRINVIKGKPTMSAELIAAQVRKAGHKLRISKDEANMSATCTIIRSDDPDYPFSVTRDKAWAAQMGLTGKDNYKKQPLTMLTWRAITACAREACPEALYGVAYTPDEMHDLDDTRHGAQDAHNGPIHVEPVSVEPAEPNAPQSAPQDRLQPLRELIKPFGEKCGYDMPQAVDAVLTYVGARTMQELDDRQVADACTYMQEIIDEPVVLEG